MKRRKQLPTAAAWKGVKRVVEEQEKDSEIGTRHVKALYEKFPDLKVDNGGEVEYILIPEDTQRLVEFYVQFMQVVDANVDYYVMTEGAMKQRHFNGKKYVRTFAAYMVYFRFLAPFYRDGEEDEKRPKSRVRPDGIHAREALITVKGLEHPQRRPYIFDFIELLNSEFPFLEQIQGGKETAQDFYSREKFGTTCQTLRTKFRNKPLWFSDGYTFDSPEQKGLPSSWKYYLKALAFPLGPGAYDMKDDEEHDSLVNRRTF